MLRPLPLLRGATLGALTLTSTLSLGCAIATTGEPGKPGKPGTDGANAASVDPDATYASFRLTTDVSALSESERKMIPLLIEAGQQMDAVFWKQAYGDREALLASIDDPDVRRYAEINYGPWDRLGDNAPFVGGVGEKPLGANFYPPTMTKGNFEAHTVLMPSDAEAFESLYTLIRHDEEGSLEAIPYSQAYAAEHERAAELLDQAAAIAEEPGLKRYLTERAKALRTDEYQESDRAWLDMRDNGIDVVIGPVETYEDALFGRKAAHTTYVLVKDKEWSQRLSRYAQFLPELQRGMPVDAKYKAEMPGTDTDLNAYDVIYYAGDCNAGGKTIAINLPNDEQVQLEKGSRRLQLKNAMRAKYEMILEPIADVLIADDNRSHVTFDAFFANTMFHEVAHGLGIKNTLDGKGTVREALQDTASALEEGKADILGLYMIGYLNLMGEIEGDLMDNYVTFLAGIFRSVRFGAASAHGKANMIRFNFFEQFGAFRRDPDTGRYSVDPENMAKARDALTAKLLTIQGDGDYEAAQEMVAELGVIGPQLQADLDRLTTAGIPVDIVFEQGVDVLGL